MDKLMIGVFIVTLLALVYLCGVVVVYADRTGRQDGLGVNMAALNSLVTPTEAVVYHNDGMGGVYCPDGHLRPNGMGGYYMVKW